MRKDRDFYAFQKKVQLGQTIGPNVIIKSGINEGDSIVIDGVQLLHDKSKITLEGPKPQKEGGGKGDESKGAAHKKE